MIYLTFWRSWVKNSKWRKQVNNEYLHPNTATISKNMTKVDFIKLFSIVIVFLLLFSKCKMFFNLKSALLVKTSCHLPMHFMFSSIYRL